MRPWRWGLGPGLYCKCDEWFNPSLIPPLGQVMKIFPKWVKWCMIGGGRWESPAKFHKWRPWGEPKVTFSGQTSPPSSLIWTDFASLRAENKDHCQGRTVTKVRSFDPLCLSLMDLNSGLYYTLHMQVHSLYNASHIKMEIIFNCTKSWGPI